MSAMRSSLFVVCAALLAVAYQGPAVIGPERPRPTDKATTRAASETHAIRPDDQLYLPGDEITFDVHYENLLSMQTPPLTRSIGLAERSMRALLERRLSSANLSFAEWTVLVFTDASPISAEHVVQRQLGGHVVLDEAAARESISKLSSAGLIVQDEAAVITMTEAGKRIFARLRNEVEEITQALYEDIALADLEITHRTLGVIADRANELLADRR